MKKIFTIFLIFIVTTCTCKGNKIDKMDDISLNPNFPIIENNYQLSKNWSIKLPGKFNRRFEDGSLVIWRPGFTIWTNIWGNDNNEDANIRRHDTIKKTSQNKFDEENVDGDVLFYSYRLSEETDDKRVAAFYCYAFGSTGDIQMAIYFDEESDLKWAKQIWISLAEENIDNK